jgi:hypothetical protein
MKFIKKILTKDITQEEFQDTIDIFEKDIIELTDANVQLMRRIRDLEQQINFYQDRLKIVEGIKINEKTKVNLWRILAGIGAGLGAIIGSWLTKDKD